MRRCVLLAVAVLAVAATPAWAAQQQFSSIGSFESTVGSYRTITWDTVPDSLAEPHSLPADYFQPSGVELATPGDALRVSATGGSSPQYFSDINTTYTNDFTAFSPSRIFSPLGSTVTDIRFVDPASGAPATVNAFGAEFVNVRIADTSGIEYFDPAGTSLGKVTLLGGAQKSTAFLGVLFNAGEKVARVEVTTGTDPLSGTTNDNGTTVNVVALDDLAYAEPQKLPGPALVITSPSEGSSIERSSTTVTGAATDPYGVASLTVNGQPVSVASDGSWSTTVPLVQGTNTITATATNRGGAASTVQRTISASPPPPTFPKPSNRFAIGKLKVGGARGVALVNLPGPGTVDLRLRASRPVGRLVHLVRQAAQGGQFKMSFVVPRKARKFLKRHRYHAAEKVSFTPAGGKMATHTVAVLIGKRR